MSEQTQKFERASSLLILLGAFAVPLLGSIHPQITESFFIIWAMLAWFFAFLSKRPPNKKRDWLTTSLHLMAALLAIQLVGLPSLLVRLFSPNNFAVAQKVASATGQALPGWLPLTLHVKATRDGLFVLGSLIALFFVSRHVLSREANWQKPLFALTTSGALLAVWAILGTLLGHERASAHYINANRFANMLTIAIGAGGVLYFVYLKKINRAINAETPEPTKNFRIITRGLLVALICMFVALLNTLSRLGVASFVIAGSLLLAVFYKKRFLQFFFFLLSALAALSSLLVAAPMYNRFSLLFETGTKGAARFTCWSNALQMFFDYPLFGSGHGSFQTVFPSYQPPELAGWWKYAHNEYLNVLTDIGLVGFGLFVFALIVLIRGLRELIKSDRYEKQVVGLGALFVLVATLLHSFGDFPLRQMNNLYLFVIFMGLAWGQITRAKEVDENQDTPTHLGLKSNKIIFAAFLLLALMVTAELRIVWTEVIKNKHKIARAKNIDDLKTAVKYSPIDTELRILLAQKLLAANDSALILQNSILARRLLRGAIFSSKCDARIYYMLAQIDYRAHSPSSADQLMKTAFNFAPAWVDVALRTGTYFLRRLNEQKNAGEEIYGREQSMVYIKRAFGNLVASGHREVAVDVLFDSGMPPLLITELIDNDNEVKLIIGLRLKKHKQPELAAQVMRAGFAREAKFKRIPRYAAAYAELLFALSDSKRAFEFIRTQVKEADVAKRDKLVKAFALIKIPDTLLEVSLKFWRELQNNDGGIWTALAIGRTEYKLGNYKLGEDALFLLAESTHDLKVYNELVQLNITRKKYERARQVASSMTRIAPSARTWALLALVCGKLKDTDGELKALEKAYLYAKDNAHRAEALADAALLAGRVELAKNTWLEFINAGGDERMARVQLADILTQLLDFEAATFELTKAQKLKATTGSKYTDAELERRIEQLKAR